MRWFPVLVISLTLAASAARADLKEDCGQNEDTERKLASCSKLIASNPGDAAAYLERGRAYHLQHRLDEALADYDKAIENDSKSVSAYISRGNVRLAREQFDEALADYSKAIEIDPTHAVAYINRGDAQVLAQRRLDAGKPWYEKRSRAFLALEDYHKGAPRSTRRMPPPIRALATPT
jgi:tetratricopeptide (TPR) repeat protein